MRKMRRGTLGCFPSSTSTPLSPKSQWRSLRQNVPLSPHSPLYTLPVPPALAPLSSLDPSLTALSGSDVLGGHDSVGGEGAEGMSAECSSLSPSHAHPQHRRSVHRQGHGQGQEPEQGTFLSTVEEVFPLSEAYHNLRGGVKPLLYAGKAIHKQFREDFPDLHHGAEDRMDEAYHAAGAGLGLAGGLAVGATSTLINRLSLSGSEERCDLNSYPDPVVLRGEGLAEISKDVVSAAREVAVAAWNTPFLQAPAMTITPTISGRRIPAAMEALEQSPVLQLVPDITTPNARSTSTKAAINTSTTATASGYQQEKGTR